MSLCAHVCLWKLLLLIFVSNGLADSYRRGSDQCGENSKSVLDRFDSLECSGTVNWETSIILKRYGNHPKSQHQKISCTFSHSRSHTHNQANMHKITHTHITGKRQQKMPILKWTHVQRIRRCLGKLREQQVHQHATIPQRSSLLHFFAFITKTSGFVEHKFTIVPTRFHSGFALMIGLCYGLLKRLNIIAFIDLYFIIHYTACCPALSSSQILSEWTCN